uniref:Uncharacterized protein n=1 Tax=Laticauda laticaudata TaxID=8630 RepID=A0A8C5SG67_LATLA
MVLASSLHQMQNPQPSESSPDSLTGPQSCPLSDFAAICTGWSHQAYYLCLFVKGLQIVCKLKEWNILE